MRRTIHDLVPRPQQSTTVRLAFICPTPLPSAARPQRAFIQGFERASPREGVSGPHPLGGCDVGEAVASRQYRFCARVGRTPGPHGAACDRARRTYGVTHVWTCIGSRQALPMSHSWGFGGLVGRERESAVLQEALGGHRLVSVTGAAGWARAGWPRAFWNRCGTAHGMAGGRPGLLAGQRGSRARCPGDRGRPGAVTAAAGRGSGAHERPGEQGSGSPDPAVPRRRGPGPRAVHGAGAAPAHGAAGHARAGDVTAGPRSGGGARPAAVAADHRDARRSQWSCSRGGTVPRTSASAWVVAGILAPGRGRRRFCEDGVREPTGDDESPVASPRSGHVIACDPAGSGRRPVCAASQMCRCGRPWSSQARSHWRVSAG
ncbi:hypothetical protein RKD30_000566 [Streptomyces pristinaespiralis]